MLRRERWALAGLAIAFAVMFGRAASYGFVWDDVQEIERNAAFDRPLADGLALTQTERTDPALTELSTIRLAYDSYRPLLFASYWIDVRLWGRSATALHLMNMLIAAAAIAAAYAVLRRWLGASLALVPTALFALHPAQVEAVAYISGRGDLLAGMFALWATFAALHASVAAARRGRIAWAIAAAIAFACSLLTKEAYLGLPVAICAVLWSERQLRARWWIPTTLVGVAVGYLALRTAMVTATSQAVAGRALAALPGVVLEYLRILVLPLDLGTERLHARGYLISGWIAVGVVMVVLVLVRARLGASARRAIAGGTWTVAMLGPSAVPIVSMGVAADRYAYLGVIGVGVMISLGGAAVLGRRPQLERVIIGIGAVWAAMLLFVAWRQVPVWVDNPTLYAHAAAMSPDSSNAQYRLGFLDAADGDWPAAIERFERATVLDPDNVLALNNLGVAYLTTRDPARAKAALARAVAINPAHFRAWYNLGLAELALGDHAGGCASIARAHQINPTYAAAREATSAGGRCSP